MTNEEAIKLYEGALARLVAGKPLHVPKGTKITKDAVSLEAGRGKGSIKKSRLGYAGLIEKIDAAALEQSKPQRESEERVKRLKSQIKELEDKLDAALAREMNLAYELFEVRQELNAYSNGDGKIVPIRRGNSHQQKSGKNSH